MLITITLVAFLVLLVVSMATLTRVETFVAGNDRRLSQARANALYALNLAMGQLQKYAGPDRAVTARADIDQNNVGNPYWTGVWDAVPRDSAGTALATPTHDPVAAPPATAPMVWLVSGNERSGLALVPHTPAVTNPDIDEANVWLLRKSNGIDLSDTSDATYPQDASVRLAKSPIEVPADQVPGAAASGDPVRIGSYAWWIGDEGVKAKVNLKDPYRTAASTDEKADWRMGAAPRPDLQLLSGSAYQTTFADHGETVGAKLADILSGEQMPMLHADLATTDGVKQTGRYFHDLTTLGAGVLADTMRGGLRRDLTRGLATVPAAGSVSEAEIGETVPVFTLPTPGPYGRTAQAPITAVWTPSKLSSGGTQNGEPHAPTWSEVRAWAAIRAPSAGGIEPVEAPLSTITRNGITCPTTAGHSIMPVVVALELGYGMDVGDDLKYRIMLRPRIVLMNPYNVALKRAAYSVIYRSSIPSNSDLTFTMSYGGVSAGPSYLLTSGTPLITPNPAMGNQPVLAFNITDDFGPGEVRIYSMPAATPNSPSNDGIFNLESGLTTTRAYLQTPDAAPPWYDPSLRSSINVTWAKIPADAPRIGIALGTAGTSSAPVESMTARYIQTNSSVLYGLTPAFGGGKPNPTAKLDSEAARQMRTVRFTLRHAALDVLAYENANMASEGETGSGLVTDSSSGTRFLVDNNPRAILSQRLGGRDNVAQYIMSTSKGSGYTDFDYDEDGGVTFGFWGGDVHDNGYGSKQVVLFDVLRAGEQVVSVGRLGQVNWGVDGKHPAYPLGNSFASVFYPAASPDYGYALNESLWDRFFFSTLPASLATRPDNLPDSRLRFHDPLGASTDLANLEGANGYQLAATRLMVDGAFNINSTSIEAWAAFLGSVQAADYTYATRLGTQKTDVGVRAFPRLYATHDGDPVATAGQLYEWTGYRQLNADQLRKLATKIVAGIKARGRPARSLAEFINRDLSQSSGSSRNQSGVLQSAIDGVVNTDTPADGGDGRAGLTALSGLDASKVVPATFSQGDYPAAANGKLRATGAPGFFMQNDLLTPLAPSMSARSDTFRIRAYGEAVNPVSGRAEGGAWCEAVVQRLPEYAGGDAADLRIDDPVLGAGSKIFGRKFVIIQFRWLAPEEI